MDYEYIYYDIQTRYNQSYQSMEDMGLEGLLKLHEMSIIKDTIKYESEKEQYKKLEKQQGKQYT